MTNMLAVHACATRDQAFMSPMDHCTVSRFFLDLEGKDTTISDDDGVEAQDVDYVVAEIQAVIGEKDSVSFIDPRECWNIAIRNESGIIVKRIPIRK